MIYHTLKFLFYFAIKGYFRSISVRNGQYASLDGPVIYVANHVSAFMDPMVIGMHVRRKLWFLARGEALEKPLARAILSRLNMIPVYRPETTPDEVVKNDEIFRRCYAHLAKGRCLIIFPEGFSKTERRLRKIKTGAARIALGAEASKDFELNMRIVPVGLNYSNPHFFQSDLLINFGAPIEVASYRELYLKDAFGAARKLTDDIRKVLEQRTVVIEQEVLAPLISNIEKIYRGQLRDEFSPEGELNLQNFYLSKEIVKAVNYFFEKSQARVMRVNDMINDYLDGLGQLALKDALFRRSRVYNARFLKLSLLVLGFPVFVYGFVNNYLPYKSAAVLSARMVKRPDFRGSLQLALGMFAFLIFYAIQTVCVSMLLGPWVALLYLLTLYPSGLLALRYIKEFRKYRRQIRLFRLFMRRSGMFAQLALQRQAIIDELENGKSEFLLMTGQETMASR
jgi:glycerol-3-phosphate O-acyltransferase/dihydroxyacetone phosphate acyltransferase